MFMQLSDFDAKLFHTVYSIRNYMKFFDKDIINRINDCWIERNPEIKKITYFDGSDYLNLQVYIDSRAISEPPIRAIFLYKFNDNNNCCSSEVRILKDREHIASIQLGKYIRHGTESERDTLLERVKLLIHTFRNRITD